uniref:GATA-type domain-containing protein n=1 Tax=Tetraselmis sp. GSL018 TaxID=582737 RepID=A0A061S552_9CHLO
MQCHGLRELDWVPQAKSCGECLSQPYNQFSGVTGLPFGTETWALEIERIQGQSFRPIVPTPFTPDNFRSPLGATFGRPFFFQCNSTHLKTEFWSTSNKKSIRETETLKNTYQKLLNAPSEFFAATHEFVRGDRPETARLEGNILHSSNKMKIHFNNCSDSHQLKRQKTSRKVEKICSNCKTEETPYWRTNNLSCKPLCNACGLYFRKHAAPRPKLLWKAGNKYRV